MHDHGSTVHGSDISAIKKLRDAFFQYAGQGQPLTLVATDVEASTSLWEWNRAAMMEAISIHDTILRSRLHDFHGYEVATEVTDLSTQNIMLFLDPIWDCQLEHLMQSIC